MELFGDVSISNPWGKVPAHPLNKLLALSEIAPCKLAPQHQVDEEFASTNIASQIEQLRKMTNTASDIRKTRMEICRVSLDKQVCDLTRADELKVKVTAIQDLVHDLESAVQNQRTLISKLQQPYQGEHLKIEAKYHEDAVQVFESIALTLTNLQDQCELLKWQKENLFGDEKMQECLHHIAGRISQLQEDLDSTQNLYRVT